MYMTPDMIIDWFYNLKSQGLTVGWLIFIGLLFTFTFIMSARELMGWFFKVNSIKSELVEIRDVLDRIEKSINPSTRKTSTPLNETFPVSRQMPSFEEKQSEVESKPNFTLNH
jgi:hypothetical protein